MQVFALHIEKKIYGVYDVKQKTDLGFNLLVTFRYLLVQGLLSPCLDLLMIEVLYTGFG